ncbi:MAG TPA: PASTA domain-containing protein, partial [Erysipelothrix sp.]|nr:PASTA domain-containing protein [Erysipelothrix sp.]
ENPKYAFYYAYQASRWHRHWSAAEDVKNVIKTVIATYPVDINEEPDEGDQAVRKEELENYINRPISEVTELLKSQGHEVVVLGNGSTVIDQYPQKGVTLLNNERILLLSQYENMVVPDMTGWSLKEVNAWSNFANIEVVISGSGFVSKQSISPNTQIVPDMSIRVDLE